MCVIWAWGAAGSGWFGVFHVVVGADDALHEVVADDVFLFEADEGDAWGCGVAVGGVEEAGVAGLGQVGLGGVACHDHLAALAHAGQEHFHLAFGAVLGFVQDDGGVVECAAAHEGEGDDFDDVVLHEAAGGAEVHHVVEGVEEGTQIRIDLVGEVAWEVAELFAGFDGGAGEDDALDAAGAEQVHGGGDGEVGLAGACGAQAKDEIELADAGEVGKLVGRAGANGLAGDVDVEAFFPGFVVGEVVGVVVLEVADAFAGAFGFVVADVLAHVCVVGAPAFAEASGFGGLLGDEIEDLLAVEWLIAMSGVGEGLEDAAGGGDFVVVACDHDLPIARHEADVERVADDLEVAILLADDGDAGGAGGDFDGQFQAGWFQARGRCVATGERQGGSRAGLGKNVPEDRMDALL